MKKFLPVILFGSIILGGCSAFEPMPTMSCTEDNKELSLKCDETDKVLYTQDIEDLHAFTQKIQTVDDSEFKMIEEKEKETTEKVSLDSIYRSQEKIGDTFLNTYYVVVKDINGNKYVGEANGKMLAKIYLEDLTALDLTKSKSSIKLVNFDVVIDMKKFAE